MFHSSLRMKASGKTASGLLLILAMCGSAFAQEPGERPRATVPPLFMKVEWVRPADQADTKKRYVPMQSNIADANVELKYYGAGAKQILTTGNPGTDVAPYGVWSGTAETPFAMTFKHKSGNLVDLSGLAYIKWGVKTSGFHTIRPVIRVAGGPLLVGDLEFSSIPKVTMKEFTLTNVRWVRLDPEKVITLNSGANPNSEIWAPAPDLTKVEEIGFVDLMPGSGHSTGGWIQLSNIEVYGKSVARK
jgi:hypothetical protein